MKSSKKILLCCQDPVVASVLTLFLDREGIPLKNMGTPCGLAKGIHGTEGDLLIVDTDCFADPEAIHPTLLKLAEAGRQVAVLCSVPDPGFVPEHDNLLRLDKPFGLDEVGQWVSRVLV